MVFNPMAFMTAEQQKALQEVQKYTKFIHVTIHREGDNGISLILRADNPEAEKHLSEMREHIIRSLAHTLYTFFNITGTIE